METTFALRTGSTRMTALFGKIVRNLGGCV
jgi:hypothetical protein